MCVRVRVRVRACVWTARPEAPRLDGAGAALLERLHRLHEALECGRVSTQGLGNLTV